MKPNQLTPAEVHAIAFDTRYEGITDTCRAIESAVNARWQELLKQEPVAVGQTGSADRYFYEAGWSAALRAHPPAQPAPEKQEDINQEMLKALKNVLETVKSWNNDDDLTWIQYRLPDIIARAEAAQQPAQQEPVAQCPNCLGTTRPHALDPQWEGKCECHDPLAQPAQQERTCSTCTYYNKEYDKCRHQGGCTSHEFWEPK